jgi:drug/metabolite transporter (DMT)-like permease
LFGGALMGLALLLAYVFQTFGLRLTTPGKNAFLTSTYCVLVPFLHWLLIKKRPDRYNATAAVVCTAGIGLISLDSGLGMGMGDFLTIVCGFFFAIHIVITARFVSKLDPLPLAMLQFAVAGVVALLLAVCFEPAPSGVASADIWSMAFLTVVSTTVCLLLQVFGQKYTPPSQAAVIMTLESVFGALSSVALYREVLTPRLIAGFVLTFAAVIISETKLKFLHSKFP